VQRQDNRLRQALAHFRSMYIRVHQGMHSALSSGIMFVASLNCCHILHVAEAVVQTASLP
jgi:hypothetical protein